MTSPADDRLDQRVAAEAAAALPPERDDEPASLRQDILDELGDHLTCAFRRELLRTSGDAAQSERNVRERFGNPATVARRLWFDAMKGKLMFQRMLVGICALLAAACLMLGLLLWRTINRLEEIPVDPEWNPMSVQCISGFDEGPAAAGIEVQLSPRGDALGPGATLTTDAAGSVDFGLRRPGYYRIEFTTPWGETSNEFVTVQPGRPSETVVVCPKEPPPTAEVQWDVTWPDAVKSHDDFWYVVHLRAIVSRETTHETWWKTGEDERLVAFHPSGRALDLVLSRGGSTIPPRARQQIERMRKSERPPNPRHYWGHIEYKATSAGIFRWDGDGPPAEMLAEARKIVKWNASGWVALQWVDRNWWVDEWRKVEKRSGDLTFTADGTTDAGSPPAVVWKLTVPATIVEDAIRQDSDSQNEIQVTSEKAEGAGE